MSLIGPKTFIKPEFILTSKEIDWNGRGPDLYIVSAHIFRIISSIKHTAKLNPYEYIIQSLTCINIWCKLGSPGVRSQSSVLLVESVSCMINFHPLNSSGL